MALTQETVAPLYVVKLHPEATIPTKKSKEAAGYDLSSLEDVVLPANRKYAVKTGIAVSIPPGHYGRIAPRSSLAALYFIGVGAGVVDSDYRGEIKVVLFNHATTDYEIKKSDRIAQLIIEKISTPEVIEVKELPTTERGEGGFGSTGKN